MSLLLHFTVPLVDFDKPEHNWNKLLNSFQLLSGPMALALLTQGNEIDVKFILFSSVFVFSWIHQNWRRFSNLGFSIDCGWYSFYFNVNTHRF